MNNYIKKIVIDRQPNIFYLLLSIPLICKVIWLERDNLSEVASGLPQVVNLLSSIENITQIGSINATSFLFFFLIFPLLTFAEIFAGRSLKELSISRISYSEGGKFADIYYFVLNHLRHKFKIIAVISTFGLYQSSLSFQEFLSNIINILVPDFNGIASIPIVIIAILLFELDDYLKHVIAHKYLWFLHEFHHSATEMTIFNRDRNSILESFIEKLITFPIFVISITIIGKLLIQGNYFAFSIFIIYENARELTSFIGHSSTKMIFPRPFSYIFMSPSLHWLHHSSNPRHFNKNFGLVLTIWDKVFGTYLDFTHLDEIKSFGFKNSQYNKSHPLYSYFVLPYIKFNKRYKIFPV